VNTVPALILAESRLRVIASGGTNREDRAGLIPSMGRGLLDLVQWVELAADQEDVAR
jgi:hypothetical protein